MAEERALVAVYADESCLGNGRAGDNPGGAGGVIEYYSSRLRRIMRRDYWVSEPATTNNRMALRSAVEALRAISAKGRRFDVRFVSDSQYLITGMTEWVHSWAARGWKRKTGVIENLELWWEALDAAQGHRIQWVWVRGHAGHPQNEYANLLATRAALQQSNSEGLQLSAFEEWLEAERLRGRVTAEPDPFPARAGFRPGRPLPAPPAARLRSDSAT